MNLGEIITSVKRQFGDDSGVQIFESDIIRWANLAQIDIARKTECIQDHVATDSIVEDGSYMLPEDFLTVKRVTYNNAVMYPTTIEKADIAYPLREQGNQVGTPNTYFIWGNILYLHPWPSTAEVNVLELFYVRLPATLASADEVSEIPESFHEDIVKYCLALAKELDEDVVEAGKIRDEYMGRIAEARYEIQNLYADSYPSVRLLPGDY